MGQNNISEKSLNSDAVKVLWTGGWDSTYNILQILINKKMKVTPFYVIDENRPSTGIELLTIKHIKSYLQNRFPDTRALINATQCFSANDIASNQHVTEAHVRLQRKYIIGSQYDWLARLCEEHRISDLQLCIHQDKRADGVYAILKRSARKFENKDLEIYKLPEELVGTDEYTIFKYYHFPILDLSKTDMARRAKEQGLEDVMKMTWFCHRPLNGKPCGACNPCLCTIEEGLGWRIPSHRRVLSRLNRRTIEPGKKFLKKIFYNRSR